MTEVEDTAYQFYILNKSPAQVICHLTVRPKGRLGLPMQPWPPSSLPNPP